MSCRYDLYAIPQSFYITSSQTLDIIQSINMDKFQSSLWIFIVLSCLQVIQGSAQSSSSASLKPLSSALDINQTRLVSNPGYSNAVSAPSKISNRWSNSTSPASTGNLGTFNSITYSQSSEVAPAVSISSVGPLKSNYISTAATSGASFDTAIVSASDPGSPNSISKSSSLNGTLEAPGSEPGSTNSYGFLT